MTKVRLTRAQRWFWLGGATCLLAGVVALGLPTRGPAPSQATAGASSDTVPQLRLDGALDEPASELTIGNSVDVTGWALDPQGSPKVEVRLTGRDPTLATSGLARPDVKAVRPGYPNGELGGFQANVGIGENARALRHPFSVVAVGGDGNQLVLGQRSLAPLAALDFWKPFLAADSGSSGDRFHFLMAVSGLAAGWAKDIAGVYKGYGSTTQRVGMAVPILYLRTTKGREADWVFDPDFDTSRKCGNHAVAEDSLHGALSAAVEAKLPVQLILNGGIWADSTCSDPSWDITDHLETDVQNCQWTQSDHVYDDDYLKSLPGAIGSPQLARSLTFNVYAAEVRRYKKRNLQAAARRVADWASRHPDLFVGVNLDADSYINPFYDQREWFDYNPGTIRQFREWLSGSGPYAGRGGKDVPNLSAWRRKRPLTLTEVNTLAGRNWQSWSEVDPPRRFPGSVRDPLKEGERVVWTDPWYQEWDVFRKHLVALHYEELARWTHEAGIPRDRISTGMGFVAPVAESRPFAIRITDRGENYDSGGVSIEGAKPRSGHLGAILYGPAAENRSRMADRHGLFATIARLDPGWSVVEMSTADWRAPDVLPSYEVAYRSFRDLFNFDARQATLMAWTGSNGIYAGQPGYLSYMSWRNTPAEEAMRDHLIARANLPRGARAWVFGSLQHRDDDGWSAVDATLTPGFGRIMLSNPQTQGAFRIVSPADQVIRKSNLGQLVVAAQSSADQAPSIEVWGEGAPGSGWVRLGRSDSRPFGKDPSVWKVELEWPTRWANTDIIEQIRISLAWTEAREIVIDRVAILPR